MATGTIPQSPLEKLHKWFLTPPETTTLDGTAREQFVRQYKLLAGFVDHVTDRDHYDLPGKKIVYSAIWLDARDDPTSVIRNANLLGIEIGDGPMPARPPRKLSRGQVEVGRRAEGLYPLQERAFRALGVYLERTSDENAAMLEANAVEIVRGDLEPTTTEAPLLGNPSEESLPFVPEAESQPISQRNVQIDMGR